MFSLPDALDKLPFRRFALTPTPVHALPRLRELLGGEGRVPQLLIKRDDLNGVALGGNKLRKLEWLLGDAFTQNCDTLITAGAAQSNHCRQTAGAGAMFGLEVHLCLRGPEPANHRGNLILNDWLGAHLHFATPGSNVSEMMPPLAENLRQAGKKPYLILIGGSNPVGTVGYVAAVLEMVQQGIVPDYIVVATGSGGTHAGIEAGVRLLNLPTKVIGIGVANPDGASWEEDVATLATATAARLGSNEIWQPSDITCPMDWMGPFYSAPTDECTAALRLLAQREGVFLDPVYSGKAMAALIAMIQAEQFLPDSTVLFWHTGGSPALFA